MQDKKRQTTGRETGKCEVRYNSGTCSLGRQVVNGRDEEADSPLLSSPLLFSSPLTQQARCSCPPMLRAQDPTGPCPCLVCIGKARRLSIVCVIPARRSAAPEISAYTDLTLD
jgi:hypothetical protein